MHVWLPSTADVVEINGVDSDSTADCGYWYAKTCYSNTTSTLYVNSVCRHTYSDNKPKQLLAS